VTALAVAPRASALGTYVELVVTDERVLAEARRLLGHELEALDRACSRFRADSELARVNDAAGTPVTAGERLRDAVRVALLAADSTEGLVDPTLGERLVALGYDRDFAVLPADGAAPDPGREQRPAWTDVRVDQPPGTVFVPPGCRLDLGATAKARGADLAARLIADRCGVGVLVSLGGDVATAGDAPRGGWPVRTATSAVRASEADETILLGSGGLATSSPGARRWRRGGTEQHHIVDPRTGRPAETPWQAVTVAAPTCLDANTAATAAVVLGTAALRWLTGTGWPARLVDNDGAVHRLGGWPEPGPWSR
jgi:thiamine biosynthesis lipoprotein